MFKLNEIKELINAVDESSIHELEIEADGKKLLIRKQGKAEQIVMQAAPAVQAPPPQPAAQTASAPQPAPAADTVSAGQDSYYRITSPMVGTFYVAPSPTSPPFVKPGDRVTEDTVVCIVEAMKLMNEIEAEVNGVIVEVLAENGQLVEYGQPLFLVKPD